MKELNKSVYNLYYKKKTDLIDVSKLDWMIWLYQKDKQIKEFYNKNYTYFIVGISLLFLLFAVMITD